MRALRSRLPDAGETLVELLVTISIMGIAGVAIMSGLRMSILSTTLGRSEANSDAYVRSAAEAIQNWVGNAGTKGNYAACSAAASSYAAQGQTAIDSAWSSDPKNTGADPYKLSIVAATSGGPVIQSWTNNSSGGAWGNCSDAAYAQLFKLQVTGPGSGGHQPKESLTVIVRKPCTGQTWPTVC
ncbi:MAG: type II secretion system protein [Marmoricola sp.]